MSTIGIIILVLLLLSIVVSFGVLFRIKRKSDIVDVPLYEPSITEILNERYKNDGEKLSYGQLLTNTDYVLHSLF